MGGAWGGAVALAPHLGVGAHGAERMDSCADSSPSREEQEKLNVWVALLNLENMYGSQESLTKVFERAVQYNEPLKVFLHLADIYTKSEKFQVGVWARQPASRGASATQRQAPGSP